MSRRVLAIYMLAFGCDLCCGDLVHVQFIPAVLDLEISSLTNVSILFTPAFNQSTELLFTYTRGNSGETFVQPYEIVEPIDNVTISNGTSRTSITVKGIHAGTATIGLNKTSPEFADLSRVFIEVFIMHSYIINVVSIIIGWMYFVAWSVSFYPQMLENYRRKSVLGLNFDFVAYNLTGHFAYLMFNVGLYWIHTVQMQYFTIHPHGINPVQLNDVVFSMHATAACIITAIQCLIYESGGQRVSRVSLLLLGALWVFLIISLFLAVGYVITWLQYLYFFSYVKLFVTLVKYIPQAVMNFRRKSTLGWCIGNVLLDFTGGILSILQMILLAYNTDDWGSIMGDPTKFGLGLFSVLFDIVFILQHYVLYRHPGYALAASDNPDQV